jgi:four helix bundle protein
MKTLKHGKWLRNSGWTSIVPADSSLPKYGLTSQIRRATVSVVSHIAEGKGGASDKELMQFLSFVREALYEVQTQIIIAEKFGYLSDKQNGSLNSRAVKTGRLLNGLIRSFRPPHAA